MRKHVTNVFLNHYSRVLRMCKGEAVTNSIIFTVIYIERFNTKCSIYNVYIIYIYTLGQH